MDELLFEGMISLRALIESRSRPIHTVLYARERVEKYPKEYAFLTHRAAEGLFAIQLLPKSEIDARATGKTHGGVLALCGARAPLPLPAGLPEAGFFTLMEGVEDPYNFGYALRALYAAGADGVILTHARTGADGTICRASAGASERLPLYVAPPEESVEAFRRAGYKIVCADQPNSIPVYDADLKKPLLLVVGGEKRGISRPVLERADAIVRLVYGRAFPEALSAASAASILAFEVLRQNLK